MKNDHKKYIQKKQTTDSDLEILELELLDIGIIRQRTLIYLICLDKVLNVGKLGRFEITNQTSMNESYYKYVRNGEETKETAEGQRWKVNSGLKK